MPEKESQQPEGSETKQVPGWLQKKIADLEKLEAAKVPKWAEDAKQNNVKRLRQEINFDQEVLERREAIKKDRQETIVEKFGPESLNLAGEIKEKIGEEIEKHLAKAKDKKQAEEILHLWQDFPQVVDILLEQNSDKSIKDEDALVEAIRAFRPSDATNVPYKHFTPKPKI